MDDRRCAGILVSARLSVTGVNPVRACPPVIRTESPGNAVQSTVIRSVPQSRGPISSGLLSSKVPARRKTVRVSVRVCSVTIIRRTMARARSSVARGPSVRAGFGDGRRPDHWSLPAGDTYNVVLGEASSAGYMGRTYRSSTHSRSRDCIWPRRIRWQVTRTYADSLTFPTLILETLCRIFVLDDGKAIDRLTNP